MVNPLVSALTDSHKDVRLFAVQKLVSLGDKRAIEPLYVVAQLDSSQEAREAALLAAKQLAGNLNA